MLMVCHHLDSDCRDLAFAESRIRRNDCRRDILHDLGAISIMSSDSRCHGPRGRVLIRTGKPPTNEAAARLAGTGRSNRAGGNQPRNDNFRVKRYIAKYTINPALAHGMAHEVARWKWANGPTWWCGNPRVLRRETALGAQRRQHRPGGDGRPQRLHPIPPQPVHYRPMFGSFGGSLTQSSITLSPKRRLRSV